MTLLGEQSNQLVEVALQAEEIQPNLKENMMIDETAKSQDFFQGNKNIGKKYTTTRIKSRNFFIKYSVCWYQQRRLLQRKFCF